MAGTVNGRKNPKQLETILLRPVEGENWEMWALSPDSEDPRLVKTLQKPNTESLPPTTIMAMPARELFGVSWWLATGEQTLVEEMVNLQLERRGLIHPTRKDSVTDYKIVERQDKQTLAMVTVLPPNVPQDLCIEQIYRYEPSVYTYPLPQNQVTLWREGGRLIAAVTRDTTPVYFQALSDSEINPITLQEIRCLLLQLETQKVINPIEGITVWGEFDDDALEPLRKAIHVPIWRADRPAPRIPDGTTNLVPLTVRVRHAAQRRREQIKKVIFGLTLIYLIGVLALFLNVSYLAFKRNRLTTQLTNDAPMVQTIQQTAGRWGALEPAISPDFYALEVLHQTAILVPADLRFTHFEYRRGKITIRGEASNSPVWLNFTEQLKTSQPLSVFAWTATNPTQRPDNRFDFTIEGVALNAQAYGE